MSTTMSVEAAREEYRAVFDHADRAFISRSQEIEMLALAILSEHHVLFKGPPGTGKSLLTRSIFKSFQGKQFAQQFTAFMDETFVFGPLNLGKMKEGKVEHITDNSLVDAEYAYLDEFFNASAELIITVNEVLNERTFTRFGKSMKTPLRTAVLTTNQDREKEKDLKPVYDRVMYKMYVNPVPASQKVKLLTVRNEDFNFPTVSTAAVSILQREMKRVEISNEALQALANIVVSYANESRTEVSDRRIRQLLDVLRASAVYNGRSIPNEEDFQNLQYCLPDTSTLSRYQETQTILNKFLLNLDLQIFQSLDSLETELRQKYLSSGGTFTVKSLTAFLRSFNTRMEAQANVNLHQKLVGIYTNVLEEHLCEGFEGDFIFTLQRLQKNGSSDKVYVTESGLVTSAAISLLASYIK